MICVSKDFPKKGTLKNALIHQVFYSICTKQGFVKWGTYTLMSTLFALNCKYIWSARPKPAFLVIAVAYSS